MREIGLCEIGDRRLVRGTPWTSLAVDGLTATIAFDVQLEDNGVVDETVDRGEGHCGVWKDFAPFAKGLVGGDQHGSRRCQSKILEPGRAVA